MEIPERYKARVWWEIHYTNEKGMPHIIGLGPPYFDSTILGEERVLDKYRKLKSEHPEYRDWRVYTVDKGKRRLIIIPANFG